MPGCSCGSTHCIGRKQSLPSSPRWPKRIRADGATPMPGYTHLQPAMPSSVGLWLHAFAEALVEQFRAASHLLVQLDCCPLGTGAGYGVPLPLGPRLHSRAAGLFRVQRNPIDVQNAGGRMETYFVRVAADAAAVLEKLSSDLLLFSDGGVRFLQPARGSHDRFIDHAAEANPDVLELIRAGRAACAPASTTRMACR